MTCTTEPVVTSATPVVLLAHGSPDPRSSTAVRAVAELLARGREGSVVAAFLEHDEPRLAEAEVADGAAVLPLLLSSAHHATVDVPRAVDGLAASVHVLAPLGHPAEVMDSVVRGARSPEVVVVAAGTSDAEERDAFATAVRASGRRTDVDARWAFATGSGARPADVARPGTPVVPWLLAPGRLLDAVRRQASAHGSALSGSALLAHPALQQHLRELLGSGGHAGGGDAGWPSG